MTNPANPPVQLTAPPYKATLGRRREFDTAEEARAYENGWADRRENKEVQADDKAYLLGWFDAEVHEGN